jgi:hypothetical protein
MEWITTLDGLHRHYGHPAEAATVKVTPPISPPLTAPILNGRAFAC